MWRMDPVCVAIFAWLRVNTIGLRSVSYLGAKLWNDDPVHIGKLSDVDDDDANVRFHKWYVLNSNFKFVQNCVYVFHMCILMSFRLFYGAILL